MLFQLSKRDQSRKTELLAAARDKYSELSAAIDAFNAAAEAAGKIVTAAGGEYARAVAQLQAFTAAIARDQAAGLKASGGPGRRRQDRNGVQGWIDAYASFAPVRPVIGLPDEIEQPDEGLLTDFEELPDSP